MGAVDFLVVAVLFFSVLGVLQYLKRMPPWVERRYAHRCGVCGRWHFER